ncbi:MAG: hypothetical protein IKP11_04875 [Paludibacteraceae bacterium]|nr:hypothetical protein [Paludibacteraceae bacterium]
MNEGKNVLELYVHMIQMALDIMQKDPDVAKEAVETGLVSEIIDSAKTMLDRLCDSFDAEVAAGHITDKDLLKQYQELREKIKAH